MKLIRFGLPDMEKPGVELEYGKKIDVSRFVNDYDQVFFRDQKVLELKDWLVKNESSCPVIGKDVRIGSPISNPSKIVCVGLNYAKHAEESGMEVPNEPVLFFKATTSLCGPYDNVIIPKNSKKTDWEVELAVVIGKKTSYVEEKDALNHVVGYVLHNDVSERAFQLEQGGQWVKGKSADTFAPLGPWMVTKDEIKNPHNLNLWLKVNGETMQSSNTSDLIFSIPHLVSYISQYMTLLPGDIISTGTPFGVGLGLKPPKYLKNGDVMELGIDGLGESRQMAVAYKPE